MTKQESQIAAINEGYSDLLDQVAKYNKAVDAFNKKNPNNRVAKIGALETDLLDQARRRQISNEFLKEEAERFKKDLADKTQLFEKYEETKKDIGVKYADELYKAQLDGFSSLEQYLLKQKETLQNVIDFDIANVGEKEQYAALVEALKALDKKRGEQRLQQEIENFKNLLQAASTYNQQKAAINKKYDDLEATLNKKRSIEGFEERKKKLQESRNEELEALKNQIIRESALYKKLNQDILGFTRDRIKAEVELLKKKLKSDTSLTPQMKADIQSTIDQYSGLLESTNEVVQDYRKLAEELAGISSIFGNLSSAIGDMNAGLSDTLDTLSSLTSAGSSFASSIASFASGPQGIIAGIGSLISGIGGLFSIGAKARESRRKAQAELEEWQQRLLSGETEIAAMYRERERSQIRTNALTLDGLKKQKELLEQQQKAVQKQYDSVLAQLQQQSYIVDKTTEKYGGILGVGKKTRVVNINATIGNQSFEDLEKLYTSGRLEGKAKELFELLQKIKQEGADINELLLQNQEEARQIFTGTTADSIVDAIADGLGNGLDSAADFADSFEDLMRKAIINSLKYKYLEEPLNDFYKQFAAAAESDGVLTSAEIQQLNTLFNSIINSANEQFDQLQQISGLNLTGNAAGSGGNLAGAIRGMSEQQAELLAGQFGGLRLTAFDQLNVARESLTTLNMIQANTGLAASRMLLFLEKFDRYETGAKFLNVKVQ
jgi:galactokinase